MSFAIELSKEHFKFSCTHFTIFSATDAERLHGHNYLARARLEFDSIQADLGFAFDFNDVKREIKSLCDELDEYVLVPDRSPYLKISRRGQQIEFVFGDRSYSLPSSDVRLLPVANVTVEELARYLAQALASRLTRLPLRALSVAVEETHGQSVEFAMRLG